MIIIFLEIVAQYLSMCNSLLVFLVFLGIAVPSISQPLLFIGVHPSKR
jgi:hypothetical protein